MQTLNLWKELLREFTNKQLEGKKCGIKFQ